MWSAKGLNLGLFGSTVSLIHDVSLGKKSLRIWIFWDKCMLGWIEARCQWRYASISEWDTNCCDGARWKTGISLRHCNQSVHNWNACDCMYRPTSIQPCSKSRNSVQVWYFICFCLRDICGGGKTGSSIFSSEKQVTSLYSAIGTHTNYAPSRITSYAEPPPSPTVLQRAGICTCATYEGTTLRNLWRNNIT